MSLAVTPSLSTLLTGVDAAIIDLDGTMVDTMGDFNEALNRMLRELELPSIAAQTIEHMVGKGSEHLLRSVLHHVLAHINHASIATEIEALYPSASVSYTHLTLPTIHLV